MGKAKRNKKKRTNQRTGTNSWDRTQLPTPLLHALMLKTYVKVVEEAPGWGDMPSALQKTTLRKASERQAKMLIALHLTGDGRVHNITHNKSTKTVIINENMFIECSTNEEVALTYLVAMCGDISPNLRKTVLYSSLTEMAKAHGIQVGGNDWCGDLRELLAFVNGLVVVDLDKNRSERSYVPFLSKLVLTSVELDSEQP